MKISQCSHVRLRGNECVTDVERLIKSIENHYKIDIRSLPQWKQLIQLLHVSATDCQNIILASKCRKTLIINNIYIETTRPSPFELTENLVRTAKIWKDQASRRKKTKIYLAKNTDNFTPGEEGYDEISGEFSEAKFTAHPNTEIVPSEDIVVHCMKSEVETEVNLAEPSHLPINICLNQHKLISPLSSNVTSLSYISANNQTQIPTEGKTTEWSLLEPTTMVRSKIITLTNPTLKEQSIQFSVLNCTTEYIHIRFKTITDKGPFKKIKILPATPLKLYPGISVTFKMIFKLYTSDDFLTTSLFFKVGRNVLLDGPAEALLIPIESNFIKFRKVFVSDTVSIATAYPWHINKKIGFPTELVQVTNDDKCKYHLRVIKRLYDFSTESAASVDAIGPNTASIIQRADENEVESASKIASSTKSNNTKTVTEVNSLTTIEIIALMVEEIVELALEPFIFKHTYLDMHPHSKRYIPVYFTKAEHTGFHQCYYDFEFCNPETEETIVTRTLKLFAEVMPHPIQVKPVILDMSNSPIIHGYCEDSFVVTNTHNLYQVIAKVKLTTKMKKLLDITPMETAVPANSSVHFQVRLCTGIASHMKIDDLVYFTFKIIFSGIKCVYKNVPPFFYEIIAPCAAGFKKIYNEKFYSEVTESSKQDLSKINFSL